VRLLFFLVGSDAADTACCLTSFYAGLQLNKDCVTAMSRSSNSSQLKSTLQEPNVYNVISITSFDEGVLPTFNAQTAYLT